MMLNEGLPKPDPKEVIAEIKRILFHDPDSFSRFFPKEKELRYRNNFKLFDRDDDNCINLAELKELLASIGQSFPDEELEELYHELEDTSIKGVRGMSSDNLFYLVAKKIKDADKEAQLLEAFKTVKGQDKEKNDEELNSENFKELLMSMGNRWTEEKADEFLKEFDPKGEGKIKYEEVVKRMMNVGVKKEKKEKKNVKKK